MSKFLEWQKDINPEVSRMARSAVLVPNTRDLGETVLAKKFSEIDSGFHLPERIGIKKHSSNKLLGNK